MTALIPAAPPPPLGPREITPLSVLQSARGDWQKRRKTWIEAGIDAGEGRSHITEWPTIIDEGRIRWQRQVSIFDPVLTEAHIAWHTRPGWRVLDPFAGGPTRGIIAAYYGRYYTGVDLSPLQVDANRAVYQQWQERGLITGSAEWHVGAAQDLLPQLDAASYDYVITCPPYGDLERYSDHPADLSAMDWDVFRGALAGIVAGSVRLLRPDRYVTWVVGDLRDKRGHLRRLPSLVDDMHHRADAHLINDMVVASPLGGKYGVIWRQWGGRSATRIHQYAHTYICGDRRKAAALLREEAPSDAD